MLGEIIPPFAMPIGDFVVVGDTNCEGGVG